MDDTAGAGSTGDASSPETPVRINKFLARAGYCSRRQADDIIRAGRVTINGRVASLGETVSGDDDVRVDGAPVAHRPPPVVLAFHKPRGVVTTTDPRTPDNIMARIDYPGRVFPVGRLDKSSSGLILLTNDGELARKVLNPAFAHEKEYVVRVDRPCSDDLLERLRNGVVLDGRPTRPCTVQRLGARSFRMVLTEGRNRQIRRMCEACGYRVVGLRRIRIMNVELEDLPPGAWRRVDPEQLFQDHAPGTRPDNHGLEAAPRRSSAGPRAGRSRGKVKR